VVERLSLGKLTMLRNSHTSQISVETLQPEQSQAGFSLLELMIAALVMVVGLTGGLLLIMTAVASNYRNNMDSTGTVLAQTTLEMIASVPANATATSTPSSNVTVVDCNPTSTSANHTVNTLGTSTGAGAPLTTGGAIDFTQSAVSGYSMSYYACQASTGDRQTIYDVRWNIKTLSSDAKLVTVAAQRTKADTSNNPMAFEVPVSIKMIVGL
jgi:prepilin-type N-terminal cleavage/methylation domain-containing protein